GPEYEILIVSWGSTQEIIKEAIERLGDKKIALLHFSQVYPIHPKVKEYFEKAKKIISIEQNATGQFANLLKLELGVDIKNRINKYSGFIFSVEEVIKRIKELLQNFKEAE
ncbi:MAG: 2-oxoacid:acceptor oxidoreductase subunit alpha, partial [Fervidobacterium sp.]